MAGAGEIDESQFKGWRKHFNTFTIRGRANVALATYGGLTLIGLYVWLKPKKKPAITQENKK